LKLMIKPRNHGPLQPISLRKRNGESTRWLKLRHKKSGQRNSRPSKNHGELLLITFKETHNTLLLPPKLKSNLHPLTLCKKDGT
jgi:hypothetical protein